MSSFDSLRRRAGYSVLWDGRDVRVANPNVNAGRTRFQLGSGLSISGRVPSVFCI
jgi:hypothetical protein